MTRVEFRDEMKRLMDFFGAGKYTEVIFMAMWDELGGLDKDIFSSQISDFIQASIKQTKIKAPALEDFKAALASQLRDLKKKINDELKTKYSKCADCSGEGRVPFYEIKDPVKLNPISFQCKCPLGERLFPNFPKQFEGIEGEFITHKKFHDISSNNEPIERSEESRKIYGGLKPLIMENILESP